MDLYILGIAHFSSLHYSLSVVIFRFKYCFGKFNNSNSDTDVLFIRQEPFNTVKTNALNIGGTTVRSNWIQA